MNVKAVVPLVLAVVLGLVAAILVRNAIARKSATPTASNTVAVVVAKQDADEGKSLTIEDVTIARVPAELAPGHVFADPNQLVGRVLINPLVKGETILETLLAPTGTSEGLSALIPKGMRAVTLEVNEYSGVAGMLSPGCRVDLISVMRDDKANQSVARTILQNIKVSAIGRSTSPPHVEPGQPLPPPSNSITLLCTPKQAQTLELASQQSRPWLVLRSGQDPAQLTIEGTTYSELQGRGGSDDVASNATPGSTPDEHPTTQPTEVASTIHRTVTFIRNGVATDVTLNIPIPKESTTVGVDPNEDAVPSPR